MVNDTFQLIRYGTTAPLPEQRLLQAGALTAVLEDGGLRYIKVGGREIIRGIYVAVRDKNWGTVLPIFQTYKVKEEQDSFLVEFTAEHKNEEIDFLWEGKIEGLSDGTIKFAMNGTARRDFLKNRVGFCVLHPMDLAGTPVDVVTSDGIIHGEFPKRISPHQPFIDMMELSHTVSDICKVTIQFEGDLFEMEDQRNWTDASYKTYCTPLRLPYPAEIKQGEQITQIITVQVSALDNRTLIPHSKENILTVQVRDKPLGILPKIGLVSTKLSRKLIPEELSYLNTLNLSHLWTLVDLQSEWKGILQAANSLAKNLQIGLELEVIADTEDEELKNFIQELVEKKMEVERLHLYPRNEYVTSKKILVKASKLLDSLGVQIPVGGGSRAYFTEFNRANVPLLDMNFASYSINPQVHAFDNASLIETLPAQAATVEAAKSIVGNLPLSIGPITFKPRFNPVATTKQPNDISKNIDERQTALFGAGWTLGSIYNLAKCGVSALTYFETIGPLGVIEDKGKSVFPIFHILADVGDFKGAEVLSVNVSDSLKVQALALRKGKKARLLVGSVDRVSQNILLEGSSFKGVKVRVLDETTVQDATSAPLKFRELFKPVVFENKLEIELRPCAIACIDYLEDDF